MSDLDQTVYSSKGTPGMQGGPQAVPPQPPKRNPLLIIGGIGCALLLCAALLLGGGYWLARDQVNSLLAGASGTPPVATVEVVSPDATPGETPTVPATEAAVAVSSPSPVPEDLGVTATTPALPPTEEAPSATPTPGKPQIGPITFALGAAPDTYEPISPAVSFQQGITEVHAIFDYSGLSKSYTWERVWYHDDQEVLRSAESWAAAESGVFDYFLNAGGEPLTPGKWDLELYVQDELLSKGSFTIEAPAEPATEQASAPTPTATPLIPPSLPADIATSVPVPTPTPKPGGGGGGTFKLAYTRWDGGQHNLYVADTNGQNDRFILGRAAGPSWTPDGTSIFFFGEAGVDRQMVNGAEYVFDGVSNGIVAIGASPLYSVADNVDKVKLYQGADWKQGTARWASVSPDGAMVAYDAKPGGNDYRIYFLGTADNQQYRFEILGEQADWSPDGQKLVYRSGRDGKTGIWISNRDDSGHTFISNGGSDSFPAWSPDGKTIAFSRDEGGNVDIYLMNVDGSNIRRLTDAPGPDTLPIYTPTGDIIFRSARTGSWGVWKMSGSGANQKEIIPNAGVGPDWAFSKMDVSRK